MLQKLKLAPYLAIILSAAAIIWFAPGCQALTGTGATTQPSLTPQQQAAATLASVEQSYALVLTGLNIAEQTGVISQSEFEATLPYRNAISAALASAESAVTSNSTTEQSLIQIAGATLQSLQVHPVAIKAKAAQATTRPANG